MTEAALHRTLAFAVIGTGVVTLLALLFITAPYGRHARAGWGPTIQSRSGWILMESPSVLLFAVVFFLGPHRAETVPLVFLAMWQLHYLQRTLFFPALMRAPARPMPLAIAGLGLTFNVVNAWLNARWVSGLGTYAAAWLRDPRFLCGAALFLAGFAVNVRADAVLRALRRPGEGGYAIPRGGLYERVSCPNYLGEILEWTGWAVATWSLAGAAFAIYTATNLVPRALANHRWYRRTFPDYPRTRKAVIPWIL